MELTVLTVDTSRCPASSQHLPALLVGLSFVVVGLDDRFHAQIRPHVGERPAETRHLLRMVDRGELPRDHQHRTLSARGTGP
jgi:hypothetical protein